MTKTTININENSKVKLCDLENGAWFETDTLIEHTVLVKTNEDDSLKLTIQCLSMSGRGAIVELSEDLIVTPFEHVEINLSRLPVNDEVVVSTLKTVEPRITDDAYNFLESLKEGDKLIYGDKTILTTQLAIAGGAISAILCDSDRDMNHAGKIIYSYNELYFARLGGNLKSAPCTEPAIMSGEEFVDSLKQGSKLLLKNGKLRHLLCVDLRSDEWYATREPNADKVYSKHELIEAYDDNMLSFLGSAAGTF